MLTTRDNPFDPHTQYDDWESWDRDHGYYTNELLARVTNPSADITDEDELRVLFLSGCMLIIETDLTGQYYIKPDPDMVEA